VDGTRPDARRKNSILCAHFQRSDTLYSTASWTRSSSNRPSAGGLKRRNCMTSGTNLGGGVRSCDSKNWILVRLDPGLLQVDDCVRKRLDVWAYSARLFGSVKDIRMLQAAVRRARRDPGWFFSSRHRRSHRLPPSLCSETARSTPMKWLDANLLGVARRVRPMAGLDDQPAPTGGQGSSS
jgi:hypothetical protein